MDPSLLQCAVDLLAPAESVAVLTGAGISAESGIPTFRGPDGFWKGFRPEEVATPEAFARDPKLVWDFYNYRRRLLGQVQPNAAHYALARLEAALPEFTLITQNVDGLHRLAGSRNVLEVHGNLWRVRCTGCGAVFDKPRVSLPELPACERCGKLLRPDVVWFGEMLSEAVWAEAMAATGACDCFMVIGTSALVHPAAGLVWTARQHGARVLEVNLEATPASEVADVSLYGKAREILPDLVARAIEQRHG
ncbi:MAG: NAD-dependent deacylase [Planctomycetes bacterium]|nr:NAD-dependent deacylase [Planctomycetota bacterium]